MATKTVSCVLLERNGRLAVLQGMTHVASREFYGRIEADMHQAVGAGSLVFFESVIDDPAVLLNSSKARRLVWLIDNIFKGYSALAERFGGISQKDMKYPPDALRADVSRQEIANLGAERNIPYSWALHLMYSTTFRAILDDGSKDLSRIPWWYKAVILVGGSLLNRWMQRSMTAVFQAWEPILLDYRNERIFRQVCDSSGSKDLFLLYGENHLAGLMELFQQDGWRTMAKVRTIRLEA